MSNHNGARPHLVISGFPNDLPPHIPFNPDKPYAGCLLCGEVFQSELDRSVPPSHTPDNSLIARVAQERRERWRIEHSRTHTARAHAMLRLSRRFSTPEAAQELSKYGMFSLIDISLDNEVSHALKEV